MFLMLTEIMAATAWVATGTKLIRESVSGPLARNDDADAHGAMFVCEPVVRRSRE